MILTVHDELVFEIHKLEEDIVVTLVKDIMEHTVDLLVALQVDYSVGCYWGDN